MERFAMLGAVDLATHEKNVKAESSAQTDAWIGTVATLAGGALGAWLGFMYPAAGKKHPVLAALNGMSLAGNIARAATKEIPVRRAVENVGAHVIATAGSLSLSSHPWIGYLAGAASANLFLRRQDTFLERMDETVLGGKKVEEDSNIIDAELVGVDWAPAPTLAAVRAGLVAIKKGQRGDSVAYVQGVVGDSAYAPKGFKADSEFGDSTESAVKKFQSVKGLPSTGVVEQSTIAAMDKVTGSSSSGVEVIDFSTPDGYVPSSTTLAKKSDTSPSKADGSPSPGLLLGRPTWQVILVGLGVLVAGSGLVYALGSE
jgi:hypothetical protein